MADSPTAAEPAPSDPASVAAAVQARPAAAPPERKTLPPHVVFLHNDPHNSMQFVVLVLRRVLGLEQVQAVKFMGVAHRRGRCAVWSGHKELAELKAAQITAAGPDPQIIRLGRPCGPLRTSVEPAPG